MKSIGKLAIISALAVGLVACGSGNNISTAEKSIADNGGRDFASNAGGKFLSCSGEDSDKDGYVTCSMMPASVSGATAAPTPIEYLCGYKVPGCKPAKKA